jgi:Tfp pilus assembly protein PilN
MMEKRVFRKCLFLFPIILAGILVAVFAARGSCNNTMEILKQTIAEHNQTVALVGQLQQAQSRWTALLKQAQANAALLDGVPRSYILATLTNSLPEHAALTRFEYDAGPESLVAQAAGPAGGTAPEAAIKVRVMGVACDNVAIGKFVSNLSANKLFANVDLLNNQENAADKNVRDFQVLMDLRSGADMRKIAGQSGLPQNPAGLGGSGGAALPVSLASQDGGQR